MVAEERKKHSSSIDEIKRELSEVREELDEVRKEREAVKRTMVLLEGGSLPEERKSEEVKEDESATSAEGEFYPERKLWFVRLISSPIFLL
jgi:hypothetical protein